MQCDKCWLGWQNNWYWSYNNYSYSLCNDWDRNIFTKYFNLLPSFKNVTNSDQTDREYWLWRGKKLIWSRERSGKMDYNHHLVIFSYLLHHSGMSYHGPPYFHEELLRSCCSSFNQLFKGYNQSFSLHDLSDEVSWCNEKISQIFVELLFRKGRKDCMNQEQ